MAAVAAVPAAHHESPQALKSRRRKLRRPATRFPCPRPLSQSGEHVWPVMECGWIEVRAIWPNKRMNLGIQPNLIEHGGVAERPEKRSGQHGLKINVSHDPILE